MKKLKLFFACLLMAVLSIGQVWAELPTNPKWVATAFADIADNATVIIISNSTTATNIALPAAGAGTSNPPKVACTVTTTDGVSTITPPTGKTLQDLAWTIKKKTSTWQFFVEGSTTNCLYLNGTSSNTALRVGNGSSNNEFVMGDLGKLLKVSTAARFVGPYDNSGSDWRTYGTENATNYKGATLTFYVLQATPSCTSEITITKGDNPANGTFVIDNSGTVCIDEGNATVNVTATPNAGYHLATVTSTVGTVGDIDGNNCAITNISANTTINVTFAANPKYTVSFNVGGSSASQADITEESAGAGITLPVGPTPTCSADGWEFAGWAAAAVASETTTAPTLLSGTYYPTANVTLYAVYKRSTGAVFDGTEGGDFYIYAEISGTKYYATAFAKKPASTTDVNSAVKYTFEKIVENEKTYFAIKSGDNYLSYGTSGTDFTFTGTDQYKWEPAAGTQGTWRMKATTGSGRSIVYRAGSTNAFAPYASSNVNGTEYFDIEIGAGTTYYLSAPTCCTQHAVNIAAGIEHGSVSADPASACEGATITLTFTPALNYHLSAWTLNGDDQDIAENTFEMPGADVTVSATFAQDACDPLGTPSVSVSGKAYPYDAVQLSWSAIANADKYKVYIYDNEDNELEHNDAFAGVEYTIGQTLSASTTYKYSVQAISNTPATYCPSTEAENTFTTDALPTAVLTLINLGEAHAQSGVAHAITVPFNLPTTAAACSKAFVGWDADPDCATAPTYAKGAEFTFSNTTGVTLYAVYATETPGEATLTKMTSSDALANGDKIVVVAKDTKYGLYQETVATSYVKNWEFTGDAPVVADLSDAKKVWDVAADDTKWQLGDATNGYLYMNPSGNELYAKTDQYSAWDVAWNTTNSAFTMKAGSRYLSCRTDLTSDKVNYYRGGGTNTTTGTPFFDIYKYGTSASTYSNYSTECAAPLADPTFNVDPAEGPFATAQSIELSAAEGTIYYTTNGDDPTSASTEYTDPIVLDACGSTTIKAIAISATNQSGIASATYEIALPIPSVSAEDPYTEAEAIAVYDGGCYNNEDVWVTGTVQTAQFYSSNTYTITLTNGFQFYYFYESFDGENLVPFTDDYIVAGDVLVAKGKLGKHNTTYQIANGYLVSRTPAASKTSIANDADHPYTIAQAIAFCDDPITYDLSESVYVQGVAAGAPNAQGTFNIYDEGEETTLFQLFKSDLGSFDAIKALDVVLAYGKIEKYNSTTYEMNQGEIVDVEAYVAPVVAVTGVTVEETATIQVGKTVQLTATVAPEDATNKNVTWSVKEGDEAYAEVSATGLVTGLAEGEATIIVTTEDGGFTDECVVTVNPISPWATVYTSNVAFVGGGESSESNSKVVINEVEYPAQKVGSSSKTGTITVTVPAYTHTLHFHAVTWEKKTMTMSITSEDVTNISSPTLAIAADGGAKASGTYTLTGNPVDEYYAITFTPVATEAQIVFTYSSGEDKRIIMYGINQEGGVLPVLDRIEITGTATALEYEIGDVFSPVGLGVNAIYTLNDVEQAPVALDVDENWEGWSFDPAYIAGETTSVTVTATYNEKSANKTVTGITVNVPSPEILVNPASVAFGNVNQDDVVEAEVINVTLKSVENATIALTGDVDAFTLDKTALTANGTISVTPVTSVAGTFAATITISDDASAAESKEVALSMTVKAPEIPDVCDGTDDFETDETADGGNYKDRSTTNGWTAVYTCRKTIDEHMYWTINGKTTTVGVITSPVLHDGIGSLKFRYANTFSESNGVSVKIEIKQGETVVKEYTLTKANSEVTQNTVYTEFIENINVAGDFQIIFTNLHPTNKSDGNKDRVSIGRLCWSNYSAAPEPVYEVGRGSLTEGNYYTICLPKKVTNFRGASIWNLEKRDNGGTEVYLEEAQLPFAAGTPFIIQATADKLEVVYEGDATSTPLENGALRGTLTVLDVEAFAALVGNIYILKENEIRPRTAGNWLSANRAYIDYDELVPVSVAPTSMPGKKVKRMPMQGQTTTDCELINAAEAPVKMMINGQLFILRGEKMYDTTGRLVK